MKRLQIFLIILSTFSLSSVEAQAFSLQDHLLAVHQVRCEKLAAADCPSSEKPTSAAACLSQVRAGITANPSSAAHSIDQSRSQACVAVLQQVPAAECLTLQARMVQPPCDMRALMGLPAAATP